jgi:hypothetical protein
MNGQPHKLHRSSLPDRIALRQTRGASRTWSFAQSLLVLFLVTGLPWFVTGKLHAGEKPDVRGRKTPTVLQPDEFQVGYVRAALPALQFTEVRRGGGLSSPLGQFARRAYARDKIFVIEQAPAAKGKPGRPPAFPAADKVKLKLVPVEEAERNNFIPATKVLPKRMLIVAGSFPYRKQVEEFRDKLGLPSNAEVLKLGLPSDWEVFKKKVRGQKDATWATFQFRGFDVERMTLNTDGTDGKWEDLDLNETYLPLVLITGRNFVQDDQRYLSVLQASRGLVLPVFKSLVGTIPDLTSRLKNIQQTLKKLEQVPDGKLFLPEHCLLRFLDVTVEPGKSYHYRLRVRMANPNYLPPPAGSDTRPPQTRPRELESAWVIIPQTVVVPPDQFIYAVDQRDVEPKLKGYQTPPAPNQVVLQIHRWVDEYSPTRNSKDIRKVGEWLVAARLLIERGEYIQNPAYPTKVPVKKLEKLEHELDVNRGLPPLPVRRRQDAKYYMPVPFGIDDSGRASILVDFEGGQVRYQATLPPVRGGRPRKFLIRDEVPTEVLIMRPDGSMIARNSLDDTRSGERIARYRAYLKRIARLRK